MNYLFDHEKLKVYRRSLEFIEWVDPVIESLPNSLSVKNQIDRASTSIPLNIAEGNGKWSPKDRCRFFDVARGSTLECAAALDIAVVKKKLDTETAATGKAILVEITKMLVGLIKANDTDRKFGEVNYLRESGLEKEFYLVDPEIEQE